ncbi:DUF6750 family protein [Pseudomonas luteola]
MKMSKLKAFAAVASVGALALLAAEPSLAATTSGLGVVAKSVEGNVSAFKSLALQIGFLIGIIAFITGLYLFWKDSKQPNQDHGKKGLIAFLVGCCLLVAPWLLGQGVETLGGSASDAQTAVKASSGF